LKETVETVKGREFYVIIK